jgi:hypothetical protein
LYTYETRSAILKEQHRLRLFGIKVMKKYLDLKGREWKKLDKIE